MATQARKREPQDDARAFAGVKKEYPLRVYALKHLAQANYNAIFTAANFNPAGQDIAQDSIGASAGKPGDSSYNNWLNAQSKPIFRFEPRAIGFHISDPGDVRVKSMLVENARLEIRRNQKRIFNEPVHALPPGIMVRRRSDTTNSGSNTEEEEHVAPDLGVMKMPTGLVFETDDTLSFLLFIEPAALTALAAAPGNCPAQGLSLGVVFYGNGFGTVEPTI